MHESIKKNSRPKNNFKRGEEKNSNEEEYMLFK